MVILHLDQSFTVTSNLRVNLGFNGITPP